MNLSPAWLNSLPPWPRTASVMRNAFSFGFFFLAALPGPVYSDVGWNW